MLVYVCARVYAVLCRYQSRTAAADIAPRTDIKDNAQKTIIITGYAADDGSPSRRIVVTVKRL